jgi:hypothetical protein
MVSSNLDKSKGDSVGGKVNAYLAARLSTTNYDHR